MQSHTEDVQRLYTRKLGAYESFISFFQSRAAVQSLLEENGLLAPGLRVLDAGAGFGTATFALLNALRDRGVEPEAVDAFDLTPAMLDRFQAELDSRGISRVRLRQANVLQLDQELPSTWSNYDLIISTSMLEYVPKPDLSRTLATLRARLVQHGTLLLVITRRNWITKLLIERLWKAERYARQDLQEAFRAAGFGPLTFTKFPSRYFWQNISNYVVVASRLDPVTHGGLA